MYVTEHPFYSRLNFAEQCFLESELGSIQFESLDSLNEAIRDICSLSNDEKILKYQKIDISTLDGKCKECYCSLDTKYEPYTFKGILCISCIETINRVFTWEQLSKGNKVTTKPVNPISFRY